MNQVVDIGEIRLVPQVAETEEMRKFQIHWLKQRDQGAMIHYSVNFIAMIHYLGQVFALLGAFHSNH